MSQKFTARIRYSDKTPTAKSDTFLFNSFQHQDDREQRQHGPVGGASIHLFQRVHRRNRQRLWLWYHVQLSAWRGREGTHPRYDLWSWMAASFSIGTKPEIRAPRFAKNMYAEPYPEIFYFRLAVVDGNAKMVQGRFPQQQDSHFHLTSEDKFEWPRCVARNIVESKSLWLIRNETCWRGWRWFKKANVRERTKDDK